jgi:SAM-dependent methyltransferase
MTLYSLNSQVHWFEKIFLCPMCKKEKLILKLDKIKNKEQKLNCSACSNSFPVINNIPRIVELDNYSESFGYQWNIYRKTQLDSFSGLPISKKRLNTATEWGNDNMEGQNILEAGSGAGRFTEVLVKTGANIFSFDYSNAVDANFLNNGQNTNLNLFQGDIYNIPFSDDTFDHVFCLGVIQHTPDPEASFFSLASKVKKGGMLYIDIYRKSWYHYLHWKYILRPITTKMSMQFLYRLLQKSVPPLVPISKILRKLFGRAGARLVPIVEFSHLGLDPSLNVDWAILDTFDMYSPAHDHPQSIGTVQSWFEAAGFEDIDVWYGDNGIVGRARKLT